MGVRQVWLAAVAAVLIAGPVIAEDWKTYSYRNDGFEVEFPDVPKIVELALNEQMKSAIARSTNYLYDFDQKNYAVGATLLTGEFNFDSGSKGTFDTFQCKKIVSDRSIQLFNVRGRELNGNGCSGDFRFESRYFLKGKWFYQVFARYKETGDDASSARRFLNSFKIY